MATQVWAIILVILATLVGSLGPILLKIGSAKNLSKISSLMRNYHLMGGVLFFGLGTALFVPALKGGDLSVLYPLVALNYIWVCLLSLKILKEKMNKFKWLGVFLIILGVTFIGLGS